MQHHNRHHLARADITVLAVISFNTQLCEFLLHCAGPTGQIYPLRLKYYWFFGRPEINTTLAELNGDQIQGAEFARRHVEQLRDLLAREYQRMTAS